MCIRDRLFGDVFDHDLDEAVKSAGFDTWTKDVQWCVWKAFAEHIIAT